MEAAQERGSKNETGKIPQDRRYRSRFAGRGWDELGSTEHTDPDHRRRYDDYPIHAVAECPFHAEPSDDAHPKSVSDHAAAKH